MLSSNRVYVLVMDLGISSSFWLVFVSFMTYVYEATHSIFLLSILIFIKNLALAIVFLLLIYIDIRLHFKRIININYIVLIFATLLTIFTNSTNNIAFIFILFVIFEMVFMIHSILKYNLVIFIENSRVEFINLMYEISYSVFMILGAIYAIFLINVSLATYLLTLTLIVLSFPFFNRVGFFFNIYFDGSNMQYENRFGKLVILLLLADFMIALGENIAYILLPPIANSYVFVSEQGFSISLLIFGIGSLTAGVLLLVYPKLILRNQLWLLIFVIYSLFPVFLLLSITIESYSLLIFIMCNALAGFSNSFLMLFFTSFYQRIGKEEFKRIYGIAYLLVSLATGISTLIVGFTYESLGIYKTLFFSTILLTLALPIMVSLNTHYRRLVLADIDIKELKEEIYKGYFKI